MVRAVGIESQLPSLTSLMKPSSEGTQFVFVGGKGGVGKTSSSSAIAIALSDAGLRTLIVSTDPAHSLGDALDVNLRSGNVVPITTESNLWALEIDVERGKRCMQHTILFAAPLLWYYTSRKPREIYIWISFESILALEEFRETADGLDTESLAASMGVPKEIIETLGISDIASIFSNPPPGIDELVALTKILQYADEKGKSQS